MKVEVISPEEYMDTLPEDKRYSYALLRSTILGNLPEGFVETISFGMTGYVVPHSIYPKGYHTNPNIPLPFISIAYQKNYISLYHFGLYADKKLLEWFLGEHLKRSKSKLDMGKSCIKFRKTEDIPVDLIAELVKKITPEQWINLYEENIRKE